MIFKPGSRWKSAVCSAEVIVVRPTQQDVTLACGDLDMLAPDEPTPESANNGTVVGDGVGVSVGKRYIDVDTGLEVLGTKPGGGSLSVDGRPMQLKEAKALPSSD